MSKITFAVNGLIYEEITQSTCKLGTSSEVHSNGATERYLYRGPAVIPSIVQNKETKRKYRVVETAKFCFRNCSLLKHVSLPNTLKIINHDSFYGTAIESLIIPRSVKILNYAAFSGMSSLETIIFEQGIDLAINGGNIFSSCVKLKKVILPNIKKPIADRLIMVNGVELIYCGSVAHETSTMFQNVDVVVYVTNKYPSGSKFGGLSPHYLDSNNESCLIYDDAYRIRCTSNNVRCKNSFNILALSIMICVYTK